MKRALAFLLSWCLALGLALPAFALTPEAVPPPLRPWIPWVLEQLGDDVCTRMSEQRRCVWPGRLDLDLNATGGRFRLDVAIERRGVVALPGGQQQWPQDITVDGARTPVHSAADVPLVSLQPGEHRVEGRFRWARLPETLIVPEQVGVVELTVSGQRISVPRRDRERVWLEGNREESLEPESLSLEVFRRLEDEVPFRVHTELVLHVSGSNRELRFPTALLEGSLPIELSSPLPARLEPSGELLVQVYPGRHVVRIDALYPRPPERLRAPRHAPPGPEREVWVFAPHSEHRETQISGGVSIDPQRTNLPPAWRGLAAHQVTGGEELGLATLRRGEPHPPPNRIEVERDLWLDLDGHGYTVRDHISGALQRGWRLDLLEGDLGRVVVGRADQLITVSPTGSARGVELRDGRLDVNAEWRLEDARGSLPATAWSENVDQLNAWLHLPPGWSLLGVSGVDGASATWLSRWNVFAVFIVLVMTAAVARLGGPSWGAVALLALCVTHGEPSTPNFMWLPVLIGIALLRALPMGRLRGFIRLLGLAAGLLLLGYVVSFSVQQLRRALYPQVASEVGPFDISSEEGSLSTAAGPPAAPPPLAAPRRARGPLDMYDGAAPDPQKEVAREGSTLGLLWDDSVRSKPASPPDIHRDLLAQDPNAQLQTGPGVPSWRWTKLRLHWSGPVERTQTLQLYLLSPNVNRALSALRIALLAALTFWALRALLAQVRKPPPAPSTTAGAAPGPAASAGAALLVCLAAATWTSPARAQFPAPELLEQLKERVQDSPLCSGACLEVPRLSIEAGAAELRVDAEVHASARVAYQLPGPAARWLPSSIELDEKPTSALSLGEDGHLYLRLEPGRHRVRARGPILGRELNLAPGTAPRLAEVSAPGWAVSGLSDTAQIEGAVGLVRLPPADGAPAEEDGAELPRGTLPTWSVLTRRFTFGVTFAVQSELERVGPEGAAIELRVPLLDGERVTSADVPVEGNTLLLRLPGDARSVRIESVLEPRSELALRAAPTPSYSERWVVRCSPMYRCDASGIAPIRHQQHERWEPVFAPWPGDAVKLSIQRPAAAPGQTATVDDVRLTVEPGARLSRAELAAVVRVSTQTAYEIELPEGSTIDRFRVDQRDQPIHERGSKLTVVFPPGQHALDVAWQQAGGISTLYSTPRVHLGRALTNVDVEVRLPDGRWLLAAGGPSWGPAILFWGHLVLILLLAPVLGRLPHSPLRAWQWALLALGLTQLPLLAAALVFGWFFAMALQGQRRPERPLWFNLRQLLLFGFTFVFLACLFSAVYESLLNTPDMEVAGTNSNNRSLHWYVDRTDGALPEPWVFSTSLWVWRAVMLVWALWLAKSLVGWLTWAWREFSAVGVWKPARRKAAPVEAAPGPETAP